MQAFKPVKGVEARCGAGPAGAAVSDLRRNPKSDGILFFCLRRTLRALLRRKSFSLCEKDGGGEGRFEWKNYLEFSGWFWVGG